MALRGTLWLVLCFALLAFTSPAVTRDEPISGKVTRVRDGDTLEVGRVAVRLQGVAAPEASEPQGLQARRFLAQLVQGREVRCEPDGTRSYDRIVALCRLDGQDLAVVLVREGLPRDCPRYSGGRYAALEADAARRGSRIRRLYRLPAYCR